MKSLTKFFSAAALMVAAGSANAVAIGTYQLLDHPDAGLGGHPDHGPYGLRMDDLQPPAGAGPMFSVSSNGAYVELTWNGGSKATIEGQIYNHETGTLWNVYQEINDIVGVANGWVTFDEDNSDLFLDDDPANNDGFEYSFDAKGKASGESFLFLSDSHRCGGHADCGPIVARGWFFPQSGDGGTNDWLVQARYVAPTPGILMLMGIGLLGIGAARRFK